MDIRSGGIYHLQVGQRNASFIQLLDENCLKERELKHPYRRNPMNTLNMIRNQIKKASALHDAQITVTKYRGVECQPHQNGPDSHGSFCYRGHTYVK